MDKLQLEIQNIEVDDKVIDIFEKHSIVNYKDFEDDGWTWYIFAHKTLLKALTYIEDQDLVHTIVRILGSDVSTYGNYPCNYYRVEW
jgi:hypothetical protein